VLPKWRLVWVLAIGGFDGSNLPEQVHLPEAVLADKQQVIAANQIPHVTEHGGRHPFGRRLAAVIADDPCQRAQVAFARGHGSPHHPLLSPDDVTLRRAARDWPYVEHPIADTSRAAAP
jgi:hypothetical protein